MQCIVMQCCLEAYDMFKQGDTAPIGSDLCNVYKVLLTVSDVRFLRIGRHGRHLGDVKLHQHSRDVR